MLDNDSEEDYDLSRNEPLFHKILMQKLSKNYAPQKYVIVLYNGEVYPGIINHIDLADGEL